MISQRLFALGLRPSSIRNVTWPIRRGPSFSQSKRNCGERSEHQKHLETLIGNREMVGFGFNGQPCYKDMAAFPFPAIRYMENSPEIMALREKEKGDWRLLPLAEKKLLYRSQYCQTFSEFQAFPSEWMAIVGWALIYVSAGLWLYILMHEFVNTRLPDSYYRESREAQLRRMINLRMNPITGLAAHWDYEKMDWKKKTFFTPPNPFLDYHGEDECEED